MSIRNGYDRYTTWNSALRSYFFDNSRSQVLLYVDDDIINEIGGNSEVIAEDAKNLGKSIPDHFLFSVCIPSGERIPFTNGRNKSLLILIREYAANRTGKDVIAFAVLFLLLYQRGNRTYQDIIQGIHEVLPNEHISPAQFSVIEIIWRKIEEWDECRRFNADQLATTERYAGRLKFQLIFSQKFHKAFVSALIKNQLKWDEINESFTSFLYRKVWRYLEPSLKTEIIRKRDADESGVLAFLESIVRHCDLGNIQLVEDSSICIERDLLFCYTKIDEGGKEGERLSLFIDGNVPFHIVQHNGQFKIPDGVDKYDLEDCPAEWRKYDWTYDYCNDKESKDCIRYHFSTIDTELLLLERLGHTNQYRQVRQATLGCSYIVVAKKEGIINTLKAYNNLNDISDKISVFNNGVSVFYIRSWNGNFCDAQDQSFENTNLYPREIYPVIRGGIMSPHDSHSYISYALPFIEFENDDQARSSIIKYKLSSEGEETTVRPSSISIVNNRIYIADFIPIKSRISEPEGCEISIFNGRTLLIRKYFRIAVKFDHCYSNLYNYDKFGICRNDSVAFERTTYSHSARWKIEDVNDDMVHDASLLDILNQLCDNNGIIDQVHFRQAIEYVITAHGLDNTKENRSIIIDYLTRLGYVNGFYDNQCGKYFNQLNKPKLVRTQRTFDGLCNIYLLNGCFDSSSLSFLRSFDKVYIKYRQNECSPILSCLPDLVLVEFDRCTQKDKELIKTKFSIINDPFAYDIINGIADYKDQENRYLENCSNAINIDDKNCKTPFISREYGEFFLTWKDKKEILRKGSRFFHTDGCYGDSIIPMSFMKNYCLLKNNKPIIIIQPNSLGDNWCSAKEIMFTKAMGRSDLLEMALCELNLGYPSIKKAFFVDNEQNWISDKPLFDTLYGYHSSFGQDLCKSIVVKLSGYTNEDWRNHSSVIINSPAQSTKDYSILLKSSIDDFSLCYEILVIHCSNGPLTPGADLAAYIVTHGRNDNTILVKAGNKWNIHSGNINTIISNIICGRPVSGSVSGELPNSVALSLCVNTYEGIIGNNKLNTLESVSFKFKELGFEKLEIIKKKLVKK